MDLTSTKILVAILFGVLRLFFGALPIKLYNILLKWEGEEDSNHFINKKRHQQVTRALAFCQSFGGGVLFATAFLHMMPEVHLSVEELKTYGNIEIDFPLSQFTISCGFFFVYFLEEFSHWFITIVPEMPCPPKNSNLNSQIIMSIVNKVSPVKEQQQQQEQQQQNDIFVIETKTTEITELKEENTDCESIKSDVFEENEKNQTGTIAKQDQIDEIVQMIEEKVKNRQQFVRYILIVVALSLHTIFEGLSIGLQNSIGNIWYLFIAVSVHSATLLFYISMELVLAKTKKLTMIIHILVLSLTSPLGILLGLLITLKANVNSKAKSIAVVLLEGLSAGTILYITFFEVLNREKERRVYRLSRALCILAGFTLMAVLQAIETKADD